MGDDNNSLRRKDGKPTAEERRKDLQVFTGVKQIRKKEQSPIWRWITSVLLSGRKPKDILMEVLDKEIVPNLQDGVYNSATSALRMAIYKDGKPGNVTQTAPGSFITNYVSFADKNKQKQASAEAAKQQEAETLNSGYETPAFPNRDMAENFLRSMKAYASKYDDMSVHDLAWMQNKSIDFTWEKYGWRSDEILAIKDISRFPQPMIVDDGNGNKIKLSYYINLPKAHEI